jgi:hypothetical protein
MDSIENGKIIELNESEVKNVDQPEVTVEKKKWSPKKKLLAIGGVVAGAILTTAVALISKAKKSTNETAEYSDGEAIGELPEAAGEEQNDTDDGATWK